MANAKTDMQLIGEYLSLETTAAQDAETFTQQRKRKDQIAKMLSQSDDAEVQAVGVALLADRHSHGSARLKIRQLLHRTLA
jgi:hypothetical protein